MLRLLFVVVATAQLLAAEDTTHIIKVGTDSREYKYFTLDNGLRVIAVSHPGCSTASAAMNVGTGSFHDPKHTLGLSHFLEHMLFLGNKKYPKENNFQSWLDENGGSANAYTASERTNFFFGCSAPSLMDGLKRWSQFFVSPTLQKSAAGREMRAVDAEHGKNLANDQWRKQRLFGVLGNKDKCAFTQFSTGTIATLNSSTPDKLHASLEGLFHKYFVAENMELVLLGREPLKVLEEHARKAFKDVSARKPFKDPENECHWKNAYSSEVLGSKIYLRTKAKGQRMQVSFIIPPMRKQWRVQPGSYISELMGRESKNSMNYFLRSKGWIIGSGGNSEDENSIFTKFSWIFSLTEKGLKHQDEIVSCFFSYLKLIEDEGIKAWRYHELSAMSNLSMAFAPIDDSMDFSSSLAVKMSHYPINDVLIVGKSYFSFDKKVIKEYISHLTPKRMLILLDGSKIDHPMPEQEEFYGFHYGVSKIPKATLKSYLKENSLSRKFQLAPKIKVLPKLSDLRIEASEFTKVAVRYQVPKLIVKKKSPSLRVWFHQEDYWLKPEASMHIRLWTPTCNSNARSHVSTFLWKMLFEDFMVHELDTASKAGYSFTLSFDKEGVVMQLSGYSAPDAFKKYVVSVMSKLRSKAIFVKDRWPVIKGLYLQNVFNSLNQAPYKLAVDILDSVLMPRSSFSSRELAKATEFITLQDVQNFAEDMLFTDIQMEVLMYGNLLRHQAQHITEKVLKVFHFGTISPSFNNRQHSSLSLARSRLVSLPPMVKYTLKTQHPDPKSTNACVKYYRQYDDKPEEALQATLYGLLLAKAAEKTIYDQLRSQEQLGYLVWSFPLTLQNVPGFVIEIQSSDYNATYLDSRIEAVTAKVQHTLEHLTEKSFQSLVNTLKQQLAMPSTDARKQAAFFWQKIVNQDFRFELWQQYVELLSNPKEINRAGLLAFFKKLFSIDKKSTVGGSVSVLIDPQFPAFGKKDNKHLQTPVASDKPKKPKPQVQRAPILHAYTKHAHHARAAHKNTQKVSKKTNFLEEDETESETDESDGLNSVDDEDFFEGLDTMSKDLDALSHGDHSILLEDSEATATREKKLKVYPVDMPVEIIVTAIGVPGIVTKMQMTTDTVSTFTDSFSLFGLNLPVTLPAVELL